MHILPRNMWYVRLLLTIDGAVGSIMDNVVPVGVAVFQVHVNLLGVAVQLLGACTFPIAASFSSIPASLLLPLIVVAYRIALSAFGMLGLLLLGDDDLGWWSRKWRLWNEVSCLRWWCSYP